MLSHLTTLLLLPAAISAATLDCSNIVADKQKFDFSSLGGPKDVHSTWRSPPSVVNQTFTIDICKSLTKPSHFPKGEEFCKPGARVCGIERIYSPQGEIESEIIPIAGQFTMGSGRHLEPKFTRLKDSASNADSGKEGVRGELNGGYYEKHKQKAIIEFVCDREWEGTEGFENEEELMMRSIKYGGMGRRAEGDDEDDGGEGDGDGDEEDEEPLPDLDENKALRFIDYKMEGDVKVLRLEWKTKAACEGAANAPDKGGDNDKKKAGWGFFTWFLIIVFLLAAAYIIFGSWLNYNRYGARGWDLIPHGDTIRDLPYIVKDWGSNIADRLRGSGGSRGGYSAV